MQKRFVVKDTELNYGRPMKKGDEFDAEDTDQEIGVLKVLGKITEATPQEKAAPAPQAPQPETPQETPQTEEEPVEETKVMEAAGAGHKRASGRAVSGGEYEREDMQARTARGPAKPRGR
jgi:hypothetical protein